MMIRWLVNFAKGFLSSWIRPLGVALAALLLLGIAGEVFLGVGPGTAPAAHDPSEIAQQIKAQSQLGRLVYAPHPELGALLAPSLHDAVETHDFSYTLRTDHAGFPNADPWPDQVDVAVLGDSLLIGPGVGLEGQFTTLLQDRLNGRTVLNLGLPGGGTEHEHLVYRRYVEPLQPELVIAVVGVAWDIDNTLHFERWRAEPPGTDFTEFRFSYGETSQTPWELTKSYLARSRLVRAGYGSIKPLFNGTPMLDEIMFANGDTIFLSAPTQRRLARGMDHPGALTLGETFFGALDQLRTDVGAAGARFVIALLPSKEEIYGAEAFPAVLRPVEEVKAELEARQLPILDMYPAFREFGREKPPFYRADIHLNQLGNQIVADTIAGWIEGEKIFTNSSTASTAPDVAASGAD
jgi:lysophospholipase L1-like esterase